MNPWRRFFNGYAEQYDDEIFTKNTAAEIDFIMSELAPPPGTRVLDVGCGTGRHSVGLALAGLNVTGVDISDNMLAVARRRAHDASVSVEWVRSDAGDFVRPAEFDLVICLCEGAMCLLTDADDALAHDARLVANMFASLRPGGRLLLNVLSAMRMIRRHSDEDVAAGRFDPVRMLERSDVPTAAGEDDPPQLFERGYVPTEIRRLVEQTGFEVEGVFGGTAGDWGWRPPKLDEYELMVRARRPAS